MLNSEPHGCVAPPVKAILRIEALLVLAALTYCYWKFGGSWWVFLAFLLAPDLLMVGYLRGTRVGAYCYNAAHSYVGPILAASAGLLNPVLFAVAIIWGAHIAFDRALGYGLKYTDSFQHTHLGMIGKK